jgi:hypothetical protein
MKEKTSNREHRQTSQEVPLVREIELRHSGSEDAFNALVQTCARLPISDRKQFIYLLLQQLSLPAGTACYVTRGKRDWPEVQPVYLNVFDISEDLAESGANGLRLCLVRPFLPSSREGVPPR